MALLEKLKSFVGGADDRELQKYRCDNCGTTYDRVEGDHDEAECPDCGAGGAMAVPTAG